MKSLLLSLLFVAILATAGFQDKAIGQTINSGLSSQVAKIVYNFSYYDADRNIYLQLLKGRDKPF